MERTEFENLLNINFPIIRETPTDMEGDVRFHTPFHSADYLGVYYSSAVKPNKKKRPFMGVYYQSKSKPDKKQYLFRGSFHSLYQYIMGFEMQDKFNREGITTFLKDQYGKRQLKDSKEFASSLFGYVNRSSLTYKDFNNLFQKEYDRVVETFVADVGDNGDSILYFDTDRFVISSQYEYLPMCYFKRLSICNKHIIMTVKPIDKVCIAGKKRIVAIKDGEEVIV